MSAAMRRFDLSVDQRELSLAHGKKMLAYKA
jgi:hypothetical protein